VLDENPPHGLGRCGEEVPSAIKLLIAHQAQIGLVDQGRGVKRVAGAFVGHMPGREPAKLVVDQRQQLRRGARVAVLDSAEEAGDLVHEAEDTRWKGSRQTPHEKGFAPKNMLRNQDGHLFSRHLEQ
jgi:hypothetical protein